MSAAQAPTWSATRAAGRQAAAAAPVPGSDGSFGLGAARRQRLQQRCRHRSVTPRAELVQQQEASPHPAQYRNGTVPAIGAAAAGAPTNEFNGSSGRAPNGATAVPSAASAAAAAVADAGLIVTCFKWPAALGGHSVSVCGSFSNWEPVPLHQATRGGDFVRSLALPPGSTYFKYLVDGEWICSPCEQVVAQGKGFNNHRLIQPTVTFSWRSAELGGQDVLLTGSFNSWAELLPLAADPQGGMHHLRCCLPQGHYEFQYFVDGQWLLCPTQPTSLTEQGRLVNSVEVSSPPAFHIHYATGWTTAVLHWRPVAPPGQQQAPWQATTMHSTASRARPKGGQWLTAIVCAMPVEDAASTNGSTNGSRSASNGTPRNGQGPGGAAAPVVGLSVDSGDEAPRSYYPIEFYVSNVEGTQDDRPWGGAAYQCAHPGGYKLRSGSLRPFPQATQAPMMLVSDLDGTMVGDGEEADACTRDFSLYWEDNAALAGGVLVYNTGRSLGQFRGLLEFKKGMLPVPDVLITAVGTKVWRLDCEGGTRGSATGATWQEDHQWARTLDEGWDLHQIRQCLQEVLDRRSDAAFWLDNGTEHPHRVCISARADVTPTVMSEVERGVAQRGLECKVIVSGTGDWRYVDVTSARAGKLAALEYVRQLYGVHHSRCVAAGDSGNDTLMLGGRNLAIVVGNAQPELVQWVLEQPQEERMVVTDAPMARGILEGLARHGLY